MKQNGVWDSLIFKKIQKSIGGNVKLMICGVAPLSPTASSFMRCVFGCMVIALIDLGVNYSN